MIATILAIHTAAAVVWVGGMFFILLILRPALAPLAGPVALGILRRALDLFFRWVWIAILTLLVTGYGAIFYAYEGFGSVGLHIRIMEGTGSIMMVLFAYLWAVPWRAFRQSFDAGEMAAASQALGRIRMIVNINLPLGFVTAAVGATGGFWSY